MISLIYPNMTVRCLFLVATWAREWHWNRFVPSHVKCLDRYWNKYVNHRMRRIRVPVSSIFAAILYGWFGNDDAVHKCEPMLKKMNRLRPEPSNDFIKDGEMEWLSKTMKGSIIILRYSDVPWDSHIVARKDITYEPLVISKEVSGWYVLVRIVNITIRE